MKKESKNEKQLLADATLRFEQKHGKTPKECGIKSIRIWHKPTPLLKTTTVVFAKTEKESNAFIWEQNVIWRSINFIWIAPVFCFVTLFAALSQDTSEATYTILGFALGVYFCALLFFLYLAKKCKKLEKIHNWNVEIYYF